MVNNHSLRVRQASRAARLAHSAYYVPARPRQEGPAIAAIQGYIEQNQIHGFDKLYPVEIDTNLPAARLVRALEQLVTIRGKPRVPRTDNGPKVHRRGVGGLGEASRH